MHVKNRLSSIENEICITLTIRDGIIDIVGKTTMVIFADHMFESSKFWVRSFFDLSFFFFFFPREESSLVTVDQFQSE